MKLTAIVQLIPTAEQATSLQNTMEIANDACNYISDIAWREKVFNQFSLHHIVYRDVRDKFGIGSEITVRCIAKVADAYKLDKKVKRIFRKHGAIPFDKRMLTWRTEKSFITIWTINGRKKISYVCGDRQRKLLENQQGESDLIFRDGKFHLAATCNVEEPDPQDVDDFIGVDMGVVNIAVDSDGKIFSGTNVNRLRKRHRNLRSKLQKKGTRAAKRLLKRRRRKETRFASDVNHCISKKIVAKAEGTKRGIAVEKLTGIRSRTTVRKSQRATHHSWSFYQLKEFIVYKAKMFRIPVMFVDPRNTSRTCLSCGCVDKHNRSNQSTFCCVSCGFSGLADHVAAENIRRAAVNQPYAAAVA